MKNKITLLFCALLAVAHLSKAQQFTWAKQFGIGSTFSGLDMVTDASGNIYFTGIYTGSGDQDPSQGTFVLQNNGVGDVFIGKMTSSGNLIWLKSVGGAGSDVGTSIALDASNNVYVGGSFQKTVDFDPGSGTYTLQAPVYGSIWQNDAFILKLDNSGNFVWAGAISGERDEYVESLIVMNNAIYAGGIFGGMTDFNMSTTATATMSGAKNYQGFVASYDLNGNYNWASMINGDSYTSEISADATGNIYATGWFTGTADFDPSSATMNLTSAGGQDVYVWKLNSSGAMVWAKAAGGTMTEQGNALTADATGNVYLTGYFQAVTDLDPGTGVQAFTATPGTDAMDPGSDVYILKLNAAGDFVWAKAYGGIGYDHGDAIALDNSNHVYIGGTFQYEVDFDPSYKDATMKLNNPFDQLFLNKVTTNGDFLWVGEFGSTERHENFGDIYITNDNTILLTGMFGKTADLDPTSGTEMVMSAGFTTAFVIKLNGSVDITFTGLTEISSPAFVVYPNPASGVLNVKGLIEGTATLSIYNCSGSLIRKEAITAGSSTVDLQNVSAGVYLVEISSASGSVRQKVVVN